MPTSFDPHVLDAALRARVILVIGSKDCGKSSLVTHLANEFFRQGYSVGVIDSDVGQSDIGPPATIGFGILSAELAELGDADLQSMYFVGSITPRGHVLPMALGSRALLDRALACGLQKILIDTTGFISGQAGCSLKQQKIQALKPDLLICLQTQEECEHILKAFASLTTPEILRPAPSVHCRNKTQAARQQHRRQSFQRYFAQARDVSVSFSEIGIFGSNLFTGRPLEAQERDNISRVLSESQEGDAPQASNSTTIDICLGEYLEDELVLITAKALRHRQLIALKRHLPAIRYIHHSRPADFQNLLLGLLDAQGECCGLGILNAIDFDSRHALISTPLVRETFKAAQFGSYHFERDGTA